MKQEKSGSRSAVRLISTDVYIYDKLGSFIFIDSDKLERWERYKDTALLGTRFIDSIVEEHKPWVDEAFFQATKNKAASSFFARGGDEFSGHWDDIQHVISQPTESGGMILQSTMYSAERVRAMVGSGLWFGAIPDDEPAWK